MLTVKKMDSVGYAQLPQINDSAFISEEVVVRITRSGFKLEYFPAANSRFVCITPQIDYFKLLEDGGNVLAAFEDGMFVGKCSLLPDSNGWLQLVDIRVNTGNRHHGVGSFLINTSNVIAKNQQLYGIHAVGCDNNPILCQFLENTGFTIGGFDKLALSCLPEERAKPAVKRSCVLHFYMPNQE